MTFAIVGEEHHTYILKEDGKLHRAFKAHLTEHFLTDEGNLIMDPHVSYRGIIYN